MNTEARIVKQHIARVKGYIARGEILKSLNACCNALDEVLNSRKIFGREKFEIEILLDEAMRGIGSMESLRGVFPNGLSLKRGKEKQQLQTLRTLHKKIESTLEKAKVDKMRQYKQSIDKAILTAQRHLDAGESAEAKKIFRRAADTFKSEDGILFDIGSRLYRGGLIQEAVEYFKVAITKNARDPRPWGYIVRGLEELGELEKAEAAATDALRNFGPNDRTYLRLAQIYLKMSKWDDAFNNANACLELDPTSNEAMDIVKQTEPRIFGRGKKKKKGKDGQPDKVVHTFNM